MNIYDREGTPITMDQFAELLRDPEYKRVGWDVVGPYVVSTVWLGLDHGYMPGAPPLIFETMVFAGSQWDDQDRPPRLHDMDLHRWSTEAQARAGHDEVVTLVRATWTNVEDGLRQEERDSE